MCDDEGNIKMDFVGRFETLENDFRQVCCRLGRDVELPKTNASRHQHYTEHYSDASAEKVANVYEDDIKIFEYHYQ